MNYTLLVQILNLTGDIMPTTNSMPLFFGSYLRFCSTCLFHFLMMSQNTDVCSDSWCELKILQAIKTILDISRDFLTDISLLPPEDYSTMTSVCTKIEQMFGYQGTYQRQQISRYN